MPPYFKLSAQVAKVKLLSRMFQDPSSCKAKCPGLVAWAVRSSLSDSIQGIPLEGNQVQSKKVTSLSLWFVNLHFLLDNFIFHSLDGNFDIFSEDSFHSSLIDRGRKKKLAYYLQIFQILLLIFWKYCFWYLKS